MSLRFALFLASSTLLAFLMTNSSNSAPPSPGVLVVANQKEHTVLLIDPEARRELAKISVGVNGHEVAVSPDSRFAYVPIYGNSGVGKPGTDGTSIDVIDLQQRKLASTIDLGKPLRPHQPLFGPASTSLRPRRAPVRQRRTRQRRRHHRPCHAQAHRRSPHWPARIAYVRAK